jgi:hypothetical protein
MPSASERRSISGLALASLNEAENRKSWNGQLDYGAIRSHTLKPRRGR